MRRVHGRRRTSWTFECGAPITRPAKRATRSRTTKRGVTTFVSRSWSRCCRGSVVRVQIRVDRWSSWFTVHGSQMVSGEVVRRWERRWSWPSALRRLSSLRGRRAGSDTIATVDSWTRIRSTSERWRCESLASSWSESNLIASIRFSVDI